MPVKSLLALAKPTGGNRLDASHPEAQIWMVHIGSRYVRRFGGRTKRAV
jgi:hypothetical protein